MDYLSSGSGAPHLEATNRYQRRIETTRSWTGNGQSIGLGDLIVPRQLHHERATLIPRPVSSTKRRSHRRATKRPNVTPTPTLRLVAPEPDIIHDARGDLDWFFSRATTIRHGTSVHIGIAGPVDAIIACSVLRATSQEWTVVNDDYSFDDVLTTCRACLVMWYGWTHDERIAAINDAPAATRDQLIRRLLGEAR